MIGQNKITSLFQYDTNVSLGALHSVQPKTVEELTITNSLMRLMADESGVMPSETFTKYKNNMNLWYNELEKYNLTKEEIAVLEKHLLNKKGVAESQESIMSMSMDPKIANFNLKESNKLRKIIAKKRLNEIESMHDFLLIKDKKRAIQ